MLIDWFTIGAQALNFIILVWLMKRFLYRPILNAIDKRENAIALSLAHADEKLAQARKEGDEFRRKNAEFEQRRAELMNQATSEAEAERHRLLDAVRLKAQALAAQRQEALRAEAENLKQALTLRTQDEVFSIARKTLKDLAGTSLEARAVEVFVNRLRAVDGATREGFAHALKAATGPATLRSAFDLADDQRAALQRAVDETFSAEVSLRFETAPELVGGIELSANGQKLAWSIADYLASMHRAVGALMPPQVGAGNRAPDR
jgi:F-type H+-transporting ATPase subunit b